MSPINIAQGLSPIAAHGLSRGAALSQPPLAPVIDDFDPETEVLDFTLYPEDEDADLILRDLPGGSCRIEIGDRVLAILTGVRADDIEPGALRFDFA